MFKKLIDYFIGAKKEFKSITWPNWLETRRLTLVVIAISIGFAIFLGAFDYAFSFLLKGLVL